MEDGRETLRIKHKIRTAKNVERSMGIDCEVRRIDKGMKNHLMNYEVWRIKVKRENGELCMMHGDEFENIEGNMVGVALGTY